jgi:hypothetical protein
MLVYQRVSWDMTLYDRHYGCITHFKLELHRPEKKIQVAALEGKLVNISQTLGLYNVRPPFDS